MKTLSRKIKDLNIIETFKKEDINIIEKKLLNIYRSKKNKKNKLASHFKTAICYIIICQFIEIHK